MLPVERNVVVERQKRQECCRGAPVETGMSLWSAGGDRYVTRAWPTCRGVCCCGPVRLSSWMVE